MSGPRITVRVKAQARRAQITRHPDGTLLVSVSAPAIEGRANRAVCRLLAQQLDVAPSRVRITRGEHAREKVIEIDGLSPAEVEDRLSDVRGP